MTAMLDKINIYLKTQNIVANKPVLSPENDLYTKKLVSSEFGDTALVAYGKLGTDDVKVEVQGNKFDVVASPIEFYVSDLVFLKADYKSAIKALLRDYVENEPKRKEITDAIDTTVEVAKRRGIALDLDSIRKEFNSEIETEIKTTGLKELRKVDMGGVKLSDAQINSSLQMLIAYYQNPSPNNYDSLVTTVATISKAADANHVFEPWENALIQVIRNVSSLEFAGLFINAIGNKKPTLSSLPKPPISKYLVTANR